MSVRRVFDDRNIVLVRDLHDPIHVGRLAAEVDDLDGAGTVCDRFFYPVGIDVVGIGAHVNEYGHKVILQHARRAGHVGVGRNDDLIADAQAQRADAYFERSGSIGGGHAVFAAVIPCELLLEHRDLATLARFRFGQFDALTEGKAPPLAAVQYLQKRVFLTLIENRPL